MDGHHDARQNRVEAENQQIAGARGRIPRAAPRGDTGRFAALARHARKLREKGHCHRQKLQQSLEKEFAADGIKVEWLFFKGAGPAVNEPIPDSVSVRDTNLPSLSRTARADRFEPLTLLSALSVVTKHVGLIATVSTTFNEPYNLARKFASLDHLSGGRSGRNLRSRLRPPAVSHDAGRRRARGAGRRGIGGARGFGGERGRGGRVELSRPPPAAIGMLATIARICHLAQCSLDSPHVCRLSYGV